MPQAAQAKKNQSMMAWVMGMSPAIMVDDEAEDIAISTDVTAVETDHRGLDQAGLSDHADDGAGKNNKENIQSSFICPQPQYPIGRRSSIVVNPSEQVFCTSRRKGRRNQ
jgi:hypothetical protein